MRPGDTLASIAARAGTTAQAIAGYNRLAGEPQPGRQLIVPVAPGAAGLPDEPLVVAKGNTRKPWVALTVDCGADTRRAWDVLKALRAAHGRLTFFLAGDAVSRDPGLVRQMIADGQEIGSHSYTHSDFTKLSDAEIVAELKRTEDLIRSQAGFDVPIRPLFRFPYGAYNAGTVRTVIADGYLPIQWTLDSLDSVGAPKTTEFLIERLTRTLPREQLPGAIMLTHCASNTADALPAVLARYAEMGLEVRPVSDVLGP